jgi:DNA recombination-dependent growth factor C
MDVRPFAAFCRYELADKWEHGAQEVVKRLEKKKFLPLEDAMEETERWGWITPEHLFDTRFEIEKVFRDPYLVFGLRLDKRKVPANLVRALAKLEEQAARAATGKPVGPAKRREIRERVTEDLMRKVLPSATSYGVVVSPNRGIVWFSNTGQRATEIFETHFEETFEIALVRQTPRELALRLTGGDAGAIERAAATTFSAASAPTAAA